MSSPNVSRFRRAVAAFCLILAPILFAASEFLTPSQPADPAGLLAAIARYHDQDYLSRVIGFCAFLLFVPAVFALIRILSGRGATLGHVGGGLVLFGIMTNTVLTGLGLALDQMVAPGMDRAAMTALVAGMGQSPAFGVVMMGHYAFALGILLLGIGLWRSGTVPVWAGICTAAAPLLDSVLGMAGLDSPVIGILTSALLVIGFAGAAWSLFAPKEEREPAGRVVAAG